MIQEIIDNLDRKINFVDKPNGFVEFIADKDGKKRPAKHLGNGKFKDVTNFGKKVLTSYWRFDGDVRQAPVQGLTVKQRIYKRVYKLKLIVVGEKGKCYYEDSLIDNILIEIDECKTDLKKYLGLQKLDIQVKGYSTDREKIGKQEYTQDFKYKMNYLVLSTDIEVSIEFDTNCLKEDCYGV